VYGVPLNWPQLNPIVYYNRKGYIKTLVRETKSSMFSLDLTTFSLLKI